MTKPTTATEQVATARPHHSYGFAIALGAAFLFSIKPILIKWLYANGISSLPLLAVRMMLALPVYLIIAYFLWLRMTVKPRLLTMFKASLVGLFGFYFASLFDLWGLEYVSAQLERLVLYAYPTFVVLLCIMFLGKRLRPRILAALVVSYLGIGFIYGYDLNVAEMQGQSADTTFGTMLILASALSFAIYVVISKGFIEQLGAIFFTCISMMSASTATLLHYLLREGVNFPEMNPSLWFGSVGLVIFATIIPTFMTSEAIRLIGPEKVGISGTIGPLATTLLAVVFLKEPFGWMTALGMAFVILGVSLLKK